MLITFHKKLAEEILKAFGKKVDTQGCLVETETSQKVLTSKGEEININEFGGITKGSQIYLKSDIVSLINFVEEDQ